MASLANKVLTTWMGRPVQTFPGCPSGLEALIQLDQVLIYEQDEKFVWNRNETVRRRHQEYIVANSSGQQCFCAYKIINDDEDDKDEDDSYKDSKGTIKSGYKYNYDDGYKFHVGLVDDLSRREVLKITNEAQFCGGILPCFAESRCCGYGMKVETTGPTRREVGTIRQKSTSWSACCDEHWEVLSEAGESMLKIEQEPYLCFSGPCCPFTVNADVYSSTGGDPIGSVAKIGECGRLDYCCLTFPKDLDINLKGTLLGYAFYLINAVSPAGIIEDDDDYEEKDKKKPDKEEEENDDDKQEESVKS